jgi:hypothetical protein
MPWERMWMLMVWKKRRREGVLCFMVVDVFICVR